MNSKKVMLKYLLDKINALFSLLSYRYIDVSRFDILHSFSYKMKSPEIRDSSTVQCGFSQCLNESGYAMWHGIYVIIVSIYFQICSRIAHNGFNSVRCGCIELGLHL